MSDNAAPGWYPVDHNTLRWWDGSQWTDQTQPRVANAVGGTHPAYNPYPAYGPYGPQYQDSTSALVICGYIFSVVCSPVGLILGIIAWNKLNPAERKHGPWIVLISAILTILMVVWIVVIISDVNHQIQTLQSY